MRRADRKVGSMLAALKVDVELGVAVINPDRVDLAHQPHIRRPLDLTTCGLSRRTSGLHWTMALAEVPRSLRCTACFPSPTQED